MADTYIEDATYKTTLDGDEAIPATSDPGGTPADVYFTPADMADYVITAISTTDLTSTATAAGTTTLTVSSNKKQEFTGTTTQTVVMPVVSTLYLGFTFRIINNSTGALTVNSSGSNLITTVRPTETLDVVCILITGTTAASWHVVRFIPQGLLPGKGATLTIASGSITPTHRYHEIDTEAAAATDDVTIIDAANAVAGDELVLTTVSGARDVQFVDSSDLRLPANFTLSSPHDTIKFMCFTQASDVWTMLSSSDNA